MVSDQTEIPQKLFRFILASKFVIRRVCERSVAIIGTPERELSADCIHTLFFCRLIITVYIPECRFLPKMYPTSTLSVEGIIELSDLLELLALIKFYSIVTFPSSISRLLSPFV